MFIRQKRFRNKDGSTRTYLQLVEGVRDDGKVRQKVVCTLGRLEELEKGQIDRLIEGLTRYSKREWIRAQVESRAPCVRWSKEWGPALIFRRVWDEAGFHDIFEGLLGKTRITTDIEEAVFAMVLNRLVAPRSKRGVSEWIEEVYHPGFEGLELQHFYRALDFLCEHKDAVEEALYWRVRDLFRIELELVLWDTTSTYFEGRGAEGLTEHGFSKDHRPDRVQIVIGVLMTKDGYPVAHGVFPGNTADIETFRYALRELARRFKLRRVVIVGDRGMVSRAVLEEIEEAGYEYIVGVKMRKLSEASAVLSRAGRYHEVSENLKVKEVVHEGVRYIVCMNPEGAERDRRAREETIASLERKLERHGPRSLVGNSGYRRYLVFKGSRPVIDHKAIRREARYDGKYVIRTNTDLSPEEVATAYKGLWRVERAFRELKSHLELRPVFHWTASRIRGHVMVCFLAFVLETLLRKRLDASGSTARYRDLLSDLRRLHAVRLDVHGTPYLARTELQGKAFDAFKAVGMRPPKQVDVVTP